MITKQQATAAFIAKGTALFQRLEAKIDNELSKWLPDREHGYKIALEMTVPSNVVQNLIAAYQQAGWRVTLTTVKEYIDDRQAAGGGYSQTTPALEFS
jgi:hypothetical protein